jgi:two-component system chemotaxis sensor kinase CheA
MRQSEEMIAVKLAARTQVLRVTEALDTQHEWERRWQRARIALQALNARRARVLTSASPVEADADTVALECVLQFLEWNETHARARAASLSVIGRAAQNHARDLSSKVDRILEHVKDTLVLQCATLLEALPHMVRDLARDQGKDADLVLEGAELEMDRRVLDALREPLLHLVRNCVDHGIERPEQRIAAGKPRRATLRIAVRQKDGDKAEITVQDDGAGISSTRVAAAAVHLGLVPAERETALRECEAASLIFESGLSTSAIVSEVSGRGLGLAIVREKVENLGGTIDVESRSGAGTCFRLLVPLTLATFRGVCVEAEQRLFVLPTLGLDRVTGFNPDALGSVENRPVLWIERTPVPLVRLAQVLELPHACPREPGRKRYAAVLGAAGRRIAFEVDAVLGDEEILVKPLGRYLLRVRNVLGATVLGSGRIAPILNVHDLLKSATRVAAGRTPDEPPAGAVSARRIRILVVEDSITARGLLKNILEASGHAVKTAVDGRDAWATLNLEPFDVVVSDVEMPRMNGFDLTARIRADARLAELPVVLLTALESREDRERGVDVGANAYIVKSDFNQQRLLELVRRLT